MTPVETFEIVLALLAGALVLSALAERTALPPAAALVVAGMGLALLPGVPALHLDPDLILVLFLPPLLMASAYNTSWRDLRAEMVPVLILAVGAVAFTTVAVGVMTHLAVPGLPLAACFTLGAIVSPPDAVAAKAVLQRLRLPRRLVTILEGESLVNDASGLVLYRLAVAATMTGSFSAGDAVGQFAWLTVGGIAIGFAAGLAVVEALHRLRHSDLVTTLTLVAAWAVYILAERLGASGVLAVVTAGILIGLRQHGRVDAGVRMRAEAVWETVVYVLEALVFVLIGLALRGVLAQRSPAELAEAVPLTLITIAVCVLARLLWVMGAAVLMPGGSALLRSRRQAVAWRPSLVTAWAGMRGVVTLAVALALPQGFPARDALLLTSFAVILFTVLVQGTTLGGLIRLLRLDASSEPETELMNEAAARAAANHASLAALEAMTGVDGPLHPQLVSAYRTRFEATARLRDQPSSVKQVRAEHFAAALAATAAGRAELIRLYRTGQIHDRVLSQLEKEYDLEESRLRYLGASAVA